MTNLEQVDRIIARIKQSMETPNYEPETSQQMRVHADQKRQIRAQIKLAGGRVKPGYE